MSVKDMGLDRELEAMSSNVLYMMKNYHKIARRIEKALLIPAHIEYGKAFVDESQVDSWEKFVKKYNSLTRKGNKSKTLILETMALLYTIENDGVERAVEDLSLIRGETDQTIHAIVKYSKYGEEFLKEVFKQHPDILTTYPTLNKTMKLEKTVSENRDEYNKNGGSEAIEFLEKAYGSLSKNAPYRELIDYELELLKNVQQVRNEKKNNVQR